MQEMTLQQLAQNMQIEGEKFIQMLEKQSLSTAGLEETLRQLAKRTQTLPEQIYEYLKVGSQASAAEHQPAAIEAIASRSKGFKMLGQFAAENGIKAEAAVQSLAVQGIKASGGDRIRNIAERSRRKPFEPVQLLKAERFE